MHIGLLCVILRATYRVTTDLLSPGWPSILSWMSDIGWLGQLDIVGFDIDLDFLLWCWDMIYADFDVIGDLFVGAL